LSGRLCQFARPSPASRPANTAVVRIKSYPVLTAAARAAAAIRRATDKHKEHQCNHNYH
jgi:hypothetical protein